ncbi:hypothetical protein SKAU_G00052350 [Synaphobranchus kaupii]|uniref:Uncharacterized protein n=1 Tax=Synaphobranchus kaupii TaxID=118154 RepID=A0A9Q1J9W7_SYNKA|nr:hypothetical protein SKAU_G00052350 [Synaphobranchus kaupii]
MLWPREKTTNLTCLCYHYYAYIQCCSLSGPQRLLLCVQDTNCTLQLLIVEQKSIKSNPAGQENKVIVIHRLVKLGPLQPRQLWQLQDILYMARSSHLILDHVVKENNRLPSGECIHMDQLFRGVSMLPVHLDRTGVQKLDIIFISEMQMKHGIIWPWREDEEHWKPSLPEEGVGSTFVTEKVSGHNAVRGKESM